MLVSSDSIELEDQTSAGHCVKNDSIGSDAQRMQFKGDEWYMLDDVFTVL